MGSRSSSRFRVLPACSRSARLWSAGRQPDWPRPSHVEALLTSAWKHIRDSRVAERLNTDRAQLTRQVHHWTGAAARLNTDDLASAEAWNHLERYLGLSIRGHLEGVIARLRAEAEILTVSLRAADSTTALRELQDRK